MAFLENLVGTGLTPETAGVLSAETVLSAPARGANVGLTAAGTTITDALQLTAFVNVITTAAASTGVKLSSDWPIGQSGLVDNRGANALNLFPPTASIKINGGTDGAAVTIAAAAVNYVTRLSATDFLATVAAKES